MKITDNSMKIRQSTKVYTQPLLQPVLRKPSTLVLCL